MNYKKLLKNFKEKISEEKAKKLKLPLFELVDKGLIVKKTKTNSKFINSGLFEDKEIPRWASKFKFTRKKYGLVEETNKITFYELSDRGRRKLATKDTRKDDTVVNDEKETIDVIDDSDDIAESINDNDDD